MRLMGITTPTTSIMIHFWGFLWVHLINRTIETIYLLSESALGFDFEVVDYRPQQWTKIALFKIYLDVY
jgi:hypothetical protein